MLEDIVGFLVFSVLGLDSANKWAQALNFFVYDSVKIILLISIMITAIGVLRTYIPIQNIRSMLSGTRFGTGNIMAAMFGALTPFCSCSSIPIFLSFLKARVPIGVTFSFLITSPIINEYLVALMLPLFGWKITFMYIISGLMIGTISGIILGKMDVEKDIRKDIIDGYGKKINGKEKFQNLKDRLVYGLEESRDIISKLWAWILVGVGIGAMIHNFVPSDLIQMMLEMGGAFTVPIVTILGVPMYGSCAAIVPVAVVLFEKGIPIGTSLAFMMSVSALSLPQAIILRRAMNLRLISIFFAIVTIGIIFNGYLLNFLQVYL